MSEHDNLKSILRMFCYGLFVASTNGSDGPRAATVSWVMQASFDPLLVAVGLRKSTAICTGVQECGRVVLHVVGEHQSDFARAFFKTGMVGPEEISGYRYGRSASGLPIFGAAVAWMECVVEEVANQTGDHVLFIASPVEGEIHVPGVWPLALRDTNWHYGG